MNTIVFRKSWFKTLERYSPAMVVEFINALNDFSKSNPINIKNDRVMDLWEQVIPLLESDKEKLNNKLSANRENGKKGGRPKTTQYNPQQPNLTHNNPMGLLETQPNPKNPIDIDIDIDKDIDKDIDIDTNRTSREIFNKVEEQELFQCFVKDGYSVEDSIQLTKDALYILN